MGGMDFSQFAGLGGGAGMKDFNMDDLDDEEDDEGPGELEDIPDEDGAAPSSSGEKTEGGEKAVTGEAASTTSN